MKRECNDLINRNETLQKDVTIRDSKITELQQICSCKANQQQSLQQPLEKQPFQQQPIQQQPASTQGVVINGSSSLITSSHFGKLKEWIPKPTSPSNTQSCRLDLLYKGSRDGFLAKTFHTNCDSKSPTITFIKSQTYGRIFGGYTEQTWNQVGIFGNYKKDENTFIFSLTHNEKYPVSQPQHAIYGRSDLSAIFGVSDIYICDNSNSQSSSVSNFPHTFKCSKYNTITEESKAYLAGSYNFKVEEIEVYQMVWV